jgi:hypothetical protein
VGACITTQRSSRRTTVAPRPSRRAHLRGDVVGLDIDVHAALVLDALDLHDRLVRRRFQHAVVAPRARVVGVDSATQRLAQKPAAASTSSVLQSINTAQSREWCILLSQSA